MANRPYIDIRYENQLRKLKISKIFENNLCADEKNGGFRHLVSKFETFLKTSLPTCGLCELRVSKLSNFEILIFWIIYFLITFSFSSFESKFQTKFLCFYQIIRWIAGIYHDGVSLQLVSVFTVLVKHQKHNFSRSTLSKTTFDFRPSLVITSLSRKSLIARTLTAVLSQVELHMA